MTGPSPGPVPGPAPSLPPRPVSAHVQVHLHGATEGARAEFSSAVQAFASFLAEECQRQEVAIRPPGVTHLEITANAVVRAKQASDRYGTRPKPAMMDRAFLVVAPLAGLATGVLGNHLTSALNIALFGLSAFISVFTVVYLGSRRLL